MNNYYYYTTPNRLTWSVVNVPEKVLNTIIIIFV